MAFSRLVSSSTSVLWVASPRESLHLLEPTDLLAHCAYSEEDFAQVGVVGNAESERSQQAEHFWLSLVLGSPR
jgi:hypothetical protein